MEGTLSLVQLRRKVCLGASNAQITGALVCHCQQAANTTGHGIFCHGWVGVMTKLVEARIAVAQPKLSRIPKVLRNVVAQNFERTLNPRTGCYGCLR